MKIGIPKEIKNHEYRVGATPSVAASLIKAGHEVWVEKSAGEKVGFSDDSYRKEGASIAKSKEEVYDCEMIIKVKEPQPSEYPLLKEGQLLFCYLHLAPDPEQTGALLDRKVIGIAYETIIDGQGRLPLLTPMSEIAGRIAIQAGATALHMAAGGKGILLGGVPGVLPGTVVVIGGGIVGTQAARMAMGLGATVVILDRSVDRLRQIDECFEGRIKTLYSNSYTIQEAVQSADLVVGAVLIPGKSAPKLVTREMLRSMEPGSVVVDVAIDQGGCFETSRPTTHSDPTYIEEGIVHYCVANMPGACARTATMALTNVTLAYALRIANQGYKNALLSDPLMLPGLNVYRGKVTNEAVAADLGYEFVEPEDALMG